MHLDTEQPTSAHPGKGIDLKRRCCVDNESLSCLKLPGSTQVLLAMTRLGLHTKCDDEPCATQSQSERDTALQAGLPNLPNKTIRLSKCCLC